jgi:hypothetical protein
MGGAGLRHPKKRDLPAGRVEARSVWQAIACLGRSRTREVAAVEQGLGSGSGLEVGLGR